jgi:hypothetical protein
MKPHLRRGSLTNNNFLDNDTGELIKTDTNETKYLAKSKEYFFLAYSNFLVYLQKSRDIKVQLLASLMMRYLQGQEFSMGRQFKDRIANECGCASRSLDVPFSELVKDGIIIPITSRLYILNPIIAFQGEGRTAKLKFVLELVEKNKGDNIKNFDNEKRN